MGGGERVRLVLSVRMCGVVSVLARCGAYLFASLNQHLLHFLFGGQLQMRREVLLHGASGAVLGVRALRSQREDLLGVETLFSLHILPCL